MANDIDLAGSGSSQDQNSRSQSSAIDIKADALAAAEPLKEKFLEAASEQKEAGADKLKSLAGAVTDAAAGFEEQMPMVAQYIRDAGDWMDRSAADVREQKFSELLAGVGAFAREKPTLAFGLATLSGFALSRFLKSEKLVARTSSNPAMEVGE